VNEIGWMWWGGAGRHWRGGVPAILLLIWLAAAVRTTPAVACGRGFPSLSKEGSLGSTEFRERNQLAKGCRR
jgi:hypothetical protein